MLSIEARICYTGLWEFEQCWMGPQAKQVCLVEPTVMHHTLSLDALG